MAFVHLFFVDGSTCAVADAFICLTPNQTTSFLASDLDPGTTGYMVAIATDRNGCPVNFNYLIGDEYVKFASGHAANLGAEAIPAVAGSFTVCAGAEARIRFDGVAYAPVPRVLALDNVPSRADGNDTLVIVNRMGGDLLTFAATLTNLFGVLYDDGEQAYSFTLSPRSCQFRVDDVGGDSGSIAGGWTISFTTSRVPATCSTCATLCAVTAPANITVNVAPGTCAQTVTYPAPVTSGTCGAVTCTPASGSSFAKGTTAVSCLSATGGGFASFTVTVVDNIAPTIVCPANITVVTTTACSAVVSYPAPAVSNNCPGVAAPVCIPASGSTFPVGLTTVNCSVTDAAGLSSTCSFTVRVNDTRPPAIICPSPIYEAGGVVK